MLAQRPYSNALPDSECLSLIGMAGAGKSTVGLLLAQTLGWAHLDTDRLIEAYYGASLQRVFDGLGLQGFREAEEKVVASLGAKRCVISTGGSVIYGPSAVAKLKSLGPVVHLHAGLPSILARVADGAERGLAIAPGQTLEALYNERAPLYAAAADLTVETDAHNPEECARIILEWIESRP